MDRCTVQSRNTVQNCVPLKCSGLKKRVYEVSNIKNFAICEALQVEVCTNIIETPVVRVKVSGCLSS